MKPAQLLSIMVQRVHFHVKSRILSMTFCPVIFVFMHISGSIFIFNLSRVQRAVSSLEKGYL